MTCTLRNVQKTFTFEEQRQELNLLAADVYSICQNAVQVPLSVTTAPLGIASLTYNNNTGEFVYTPPDLSGYSLINHTHDYNTLTNLPTLFDGDYNSLTNKPDLSIYLTSETSHADVLVDGDFTSPGLMVTDGSGNYSIDNNTYLTSVGSINEHTDVSTIGVDTPSQYDTLIWSGSVWKPGLVGNVPLTDFSVNTVVASGGGSLSYDTNTGVFDFAPADVFSGDYNDLTNKPTIPTNNNQLTNGAGYITGIGTFSIGALDDVDTTTVAPSPDKVLKWDGSNWVPGDASVVANLSDLGDVDVTNDAGTDGLVLKYQHSSGNWIAAPDQTATGGSGISLTDLSVTVAQTPVGSGNLSYDDGIGVFTYTPPDFSAIGGLALTDLSVTQNSASGSGALTYDDTTGEFEYTPPSIPAAQIKSDWNSTTGLSEILNKPTLFSGSYNDLTDTPTLFSGSYNDLTDTPTLFDGDYNSLSNLPTLFSGSYNDLTDKPTIPSNLHDLSDVSSANPISGMVLTWDGSYWAPDTTNYIQSDWNQSNINSADYIKNKPAIPAAQIQADWNQSSTSALDYIKNKPTIPTKIEDLDVTLNQLSNGHVLKWNGTNWENAVDLTGAGGSGISLSDLSVGEESIASGDGGISYNENTGVFTYTPPVIPSSVQSDWDQNSSSAADYIKNKPAIPAAQIKSDWLESNSSSLSFIDNKPTIPESPVKSDWNATTGLSEILNKPTIPTNNNQLTNGAGYITSSTQVKSDWNATSGAAEILNKPAIASQTQSDWDQTDSNQIDYIQNKPAIPAAQIQSDWNETGTSNLNYIQNKPNLFSGSYNDLTDTPTIPAAQIQSDWNQSSTSALDYIKNKPNILTAESDTLDTVTGRGNTTSNAITVGNLTCSNLTVNGTTTTVNSNTVNIGDNILVLNSDESGAPSQNGGIEIERGSSSNVSLRWNEGTDKWQYTNDGSNFSDIGSGDLPVASTTVLGGVKIDGTSITISNEVISVGVLASVNDVTLTGSPSPGQVLTYTNSGWTNEDAGGGFEVGMIMMYHGTTAPSGWYLCDGNNGTPDLRNKFILGAGSSYSWKDEGGYTDSISVSHSHGSGNYGTSNTGNHNHGSGNMGTSNTGDHTHSFSASGNTNGGGGHGHGYSANASGNTDEGGQHYHSFKRGNTENWGEDNQVAGWGDEANYGWSGVTANSPTHSHSFSGLSISGNTNNVNDHTHGFSFNANTNNTGSHSHNVNGNTSNTGSHSHNVNGNSNNEGSSGSGRNLPPYFALTYIMYGGAS